MEAALAFCIANRLKVICVTLEDLSPQWTVTNQTSIGFVNPGAITGVGATIEEALKLYMASALDQRAVYKEQLEVYTTDATVADAAVVTAFGKDERLAVDVVAEVEEVVKG